MAQRKSQESVDEILQDVARQMKLEQATSNRRNNDVDAILADLGMGRTVRAPRPVHQLEESKPVQPEAPGLEKFKPIENSKPAVKLEVQKPVEPFETEPKPVTKPEPKPVVKPAPLQVEVPAQGEEHLENPSELLQNDERFKNFFGKSVVVIPGEESHAFEDTEEFDTPKEKKKKKLGFFARRKKWEEIVEEPAPQQVEPVEIDSYRFGEEEQIPRQEPTAGQQFYEARKSTPVISREEKQLAWTQSLELLGKQDMNYASAWAKAETKKERSFQFDIPKTSGVGKMTIVSPGAKQEKPSALGKEEPAQQAVPSSSESGFTDELMKAGLFSIAKKPPRSKPVQPNPVEQAAEPLQPAWAPADEVDLRMEEVTAPPISPEESMVSEATREENTANTDSLEFAARIAENINTQVMTSPINISGLLEEEEVQEELEEQSRKKGLKLFGKPQDEIEEPESPFSTQELASQEEMEDDYNHPEDAVAVEADLADMAFKLRLRAIITGLLAAMLIYLGLAGGILPTIAAVDPIQQPSAFLLVNLIAVLIAAILSHSAITGGLAGLVGQPNQDSAPALAVIGAVVQLVAFLVVPKWYDAHSMPVLAPIVLLLLCFNAIGKQIISQVVLENFQLVSNGLDHSAAYRLRDTQLVKELAEGLNIEKPDLLLNRPTVLVRGFLANSFSQRKSDRTGKTAALLVLAVSLICAAVSFLLHKNVGETITVLATALALGAPMTGTLVSAIPEACLASNASRVGAVVPGWNSIRQLGSANVVQVSMGDLFPAGCVQLHGIKAFEKERLDLAILYAASILVEASDTMQGVFMKVLQNDRRLLLPVENLTTELGLGFVGWIQNNRVIVGGRDIMDKYGVQLPNEEYVERYTKGTRYPVFLAVSGKLFGMFVVSYKANSEAADALTNLNSDGVSFLVAGTDFILNSQMIEDIYGLLPGTVKVLSAEESDRLAPGIAWLSESEGCMIHLGSFASYAGGMLAAAGAAKAEKLAGNAMLAVVGLFCAVCLVFTFLGNLATMSLLQMLVIKVAAAGVLVLLPLIQRYK